MTGAGARIGLILSFNFSIDVMAELRYLRSFGAVQIKKCYVSYHLMPVYIYKPPAQPLPQVEVSRQAGGDRAPGRVILLSSLRHTACRRRKPDFENLLGVSHMFRSVSTMVPAVDLERAVKFYTEVLELEHVQSDSGPAVVQCPDGTRIYIYERAPTKADHNAAVFMVDDIEAAVSTLKGRSVHFEELDMPEHGIKTENGIATLGNNKGAWFKDSEGNTFMIVQ